MPVEALSNKSPRTSGRILIVDDNDSNRDLLARRLSKHGYETVSASDGHAALSEVAGSAFDLLLLDVEMPGMSGLEVLRTIRTERSSIQLPIIMVTAHDESVHIVQALGWGANDYITKPIDFPVALARIQTHVSMRRSEEARRESEERYALAAAGSNDGIWDWNLRTGEIFFSGRWKLMIGLEEDCPTTSPDDWFSKIHPDDRVRVEADLKAHADGIDLHFENEHRILHRDGTYRWMLTRGLAVRDASGIAYRIAGSQTDITTGKVADPLTGLPNRVLLMDRLSRLTERVKRHPDATFGVLFVDLDHFKLINDSLGHVAGDQLLVALSRRLELNLRAGDEVTRYTDGTLARLGGDEFAVLLEHIDNAADAVSVGERLIAALHQPFHVASREVFIGASVGVALSSMGFENPEDLIRDADTAMYRAKTKGRGRVEVFDTEMRDSTVARLALETDLRQACTKKEFQNWYQLIVSLRSGMICGFEALVRWLHPVRGIVLPQEFITVAEETSLILPIGQHVLMEACYHTWAWQQRHQGEPPLIVSVNLSARQFQQTDLIAQVQAALMTSGLKPATLKLEITESMVMSDADAATRTLKALKALGVKIGIDDFGTGYSSFSHLHRFPLDSLKIDRSFINGMEFEPEKLEIVRTIISLAHNLDLDVIAEGVESPEQMRLLAEAGCEFGQGYFFSRPVDARSTEDLIAAEPNWLKEIEKSVNV